MEEQPEGEALTEMIRTWVPPSLKGMIESRIDLLDRRRKLVLQCAAVLGQRFAFQLIELFDIVRDGLLARLYSLKGLEFLDDIKTPRELEFLFHHHMIREIAYQSLLERQRSDLHDLIAARIEVTFKNRLEDLYPVLAFHYELANNRAQAIRYLELAGERAVEQAALPEAIHFFESALERLEKGAAGDNQPTVEEQTQMGQILWTKGRLHRLLGQYEDAVGAFRKGSVLPAVEKDRLMRARFGLEFGMTHMQTGAYAEARKAAQEALPVLKEFEDFRGLAAASNVEGYCAWGEGRWAEAREAWNETAQLSGRIKDLALEADARNNLALLDWKTGKLAEALAGFRKNLRLQHKTCSRFGVASTLMNMGIIEENLGKPGDAEAHYLQALEIAERLRYPQVQTWIYGNLANLGLVREQYPLAVEHGARSLQLAVSIGDLRSQAIAHENLALGYHYLCQPDEVAKNLRQGRTIARKIGDRERLFSLDLVEVEALMSAGDEAGLNKSLGRVKKKLVESENTLKTEGFLVELPRLMRLWGQFHFLKNQKKETLEAVEKGLNEAARQQNRVEEMRLQQLRKRIG
jgi:tetratricopeptide (TPR) repeat protein